MHYEMRARTAGQHGGAQVREDAGIVQGDSESIISGRTVAFQAHIRADGVWGAEELKSLVDEVGSEVEQHSGSSTSFLPPGSGPTGRAESVEMRFVGDDSAELL